MEAKRLKNGTVIEIVHGDIVDMESDIIVNAANNSLKMGSGVAGAIKTKGGIEIEEEAVSKGPIEIGQAVETNAGRLGIRYIIHAAVMGTDLRTNDRYIRAAALNSLILGEKLKMRSISLPALGTGVGAYPIQDCAKIMFDEAKRFDSTEPDHLKRLYFVLFSKSAFEKFEVVFRSF